MTVLQLNDGKNINVLGEVSVEGKQHFICAVTPFYNNELLITHVLLSSNNFNLNREFVEVVNNEPVSSGEISEDNKPQITEI